MEIGKNAIKCPCGKTGLIDIKKWGPTSFNYITVLGYKDWYFYKEDDAIKAVCPSCRKVYEILREREKENSIRSDRIRTQYREILEELITKQKEAHLKAVETQEITDLNWKIKNLLEDAISSIKEAELLIEKEKENGSN